MALESSVLCLANYVETEHWLFCAIFTLTQNF